MASTPPKIIGSKEIYHGITINLSVDTIREGEQVYTREVVRHPGSAVIVPVYPDGTIAFVRQYRHPTVRYLLEFPAGSLADKERPEEGAARELEEELGVVAARLEKLTEFWVSPGFCEEKMWVYLASDFTETAQKLDWDEQVEIVRLPFARALEMITDGEIEDAKTIIGLLFAAQRLGYSGGIIQFPSI